MNRPTAIAAAIACLSALPAAALADEAATGYAAMLAADAQALHDTYQDNHPGTVDPLNPGFKRTLDAGLKRALTRAKSVKDYGGYWWAMREYIASFDDGHVGISTNNKAPSLKVTWPGFLTRYEGERQVVATRLEEATAPPLGAELVSCDGIAAARLAADNVGHFRGRWFLASQRAQHGGRLFLDAQNPWIKLPKTCLFKVEGKRMSYALAWRPMSDEEVGKRLGETSIPFRAPIERRAFGDGGVWISAGSFDGDPDSAASKALTALASELEGDAVNLRAARVIVFDVRGNGGGSSRWPQRIAEAVFGETWVATHRPVGSSGVDWRVSSANIEAMKDYRTAMQREPNPSPQVMAWLETAIAGMEAAQKAGRPLWREEDSGPPAQAPVVPAAPLTRARVYILTDPACGSACLDGVDQWKAAGAVQVGRETSADTLYMEVRDQPMPGGIATISVPMKVYRGRARGSNQPQRPTYEATARMDDTKALELWIAGLPGR